VSLGSSLERPGVLFRILQGAAGALLVPGSLALLTANFSGEVQGRAFGIWAGASGATTILGPVLGGPLVDTLSWRAAGAARPPRLPSRESELRWAIDEFQGGLRRS
jgi:MFS family permease